MSARMTTTMASTVINIYPEVPKGARQRLTVAEFDTVLGPMFAVADQMGLYLLQFVSKDGIHVDVERASKRLKAEIMPGTTRPLQTIESELAVYFSDTLHSFQTPVYLVGSDFQKRAWEALMHIPYGQTWSYLDQACFVGNPLAYRAVANANGANPLVVMVPCHRIINHSGALGGYGGGLERKKWLLNHERRAQL